MKNNADIFVTRYPEHFDYFYSCLKLFVYSYQQLANSNRTFSREEIHNTAKEILNSPNAKNPIEDYLRNILVEEYVKPNQSLFEIDDLIFECGIEETKKHIKIGDLDIKVSLDNTTNKKYFVFECKRLNKDQDKINYYIEEGMSRFISRKYYPEMDIGIAGMIAFVEEEIKVRNKPLSTEKVAEKLKSNISANKEKLMLVENMTYFNINTQEIANFQNSYLSKHKCNDKSDLDIHHLLFNYYSILLS